MYFGQNSVRGITSKSSLAIELHLILKILPASYQEEYPLQHEGILSDWKFGVIQIWKVMLEFQFQLFEMGFSFGYNYIF